MVLITAVIEAFEQRDIAVTDILGAFLLADMDEVVHMQLRGPLSLPMVKLAPGEFGDKLVWETGQVELYVRLLNALYGCLCSFALF